MCEGWSPSPDGLCEGCLEADEEVREARDRAEQMRGFAVIVL
jgi:hypothetical protein